MNLKSLHIWFELLRTLDVHVQINVGARKGEIACQGPFFWALSSRVTVEMCNRDSKRKPTLQRPGFGWDFSQRYPPPAPAVLAPWLYIFFPTKSPVSVSVTPQNYFTTPLSTRHCLRTHCRHTSSCSFKSARGSQRDLDEGCEAWQGGPCSAQTGSLWRHGLIPTTSESPNVPHPSPG